MFVRRSTALACGDGTVGRARPVPAPCHTRDIGRPVPYHHLCSVISKRYRKQGNRRRASSHDFPMSTMRRMAHFAGERHRKAIAWRSLDSTPFQPAATISGRQLASIVVHADLALALSDLCPHMPRSNETTYVCIFRTVRFKTAS